MNEQLGGDIDLKLQDTEKFFGHKGTQDRPQSAATKSHSNGQIPQEGYPDSVRSKRPSWIPAFIYKAMKTDEHKFSSGKLKKQKQKKKQKFKSQRQGGESLKPESFHESHRQGEDSDEDTEADEYFEADEDIESKLFRAAANEDMDMIKFLIGNGTDIHMKNRKGESVLVLGAQNGHETLVRVLLQSEFRYKNHKDECGKALRVAAENGYEGVVQALIEHGPDVVDWVDDKGLRAIQKAAANGRKGVVLIFWGKMMRERFESLERKIYLSGWHEPI